MYKQNYKFHSTISSTATSIKFNEICVNSHRSQQKNETNIKYDHIRVRFSYMRKYDLLYIIRQLDTIVHQ